MIVRGRHPHLRQALAAALLLAPAAALFGVLVAWPAMRALWVSTQRWTGFSPRTEPVGGEHYATLFGPTAMRWMPLLGAAVLLLGATAVAGQLLRRSRPTARAQRLARRLGGLAMLGIVAAVGTFLLVWLLVWNDGDSFFRGCVRNNFTYMIVGGLFHFVYAFLFAAALGLPAFRGKAFFRTMIFFPSFISAIGVAMLWQRIYDPSNGLANFLLRLCRIDPFAWLSGDNMLNSIIVCGVWAGVGSQMILLLAGMQRIPPTYYEAARIDGAGEGQVFRHITLPMLREVILIVLTLWVIGSLKVFGLFQAFTISHTEKTSVVSVRQYELAFSNRDNIYMMGYATAMAVVLLVLVVLGTMAMRSLREREPLEF
ncbi:MAG: hypothetical protein BIFFINMI_00079 [Phycisphaerae bacterium]|nr:hypothetical protein [Phycisphaerae bacterium]